MTPVPEYVTVSMTAQLFVQALGAIGAELPLEKERGE